MEVLSWLLLEAFAAAALVLLVVWWTFPRKRKPRNDKPDAGDDRKEK
jgi:membrane protein implicated in regulation of membrane protease activity